MNETKEETSSRRVRVAIRRLADAALQMPLMRTSFDFWLFVV